MTDLATALTILKPDHTFKVLNGTQLVWEDERPQPTEEEIESKLSELKAAEPIRLLRAKRDELIDATDWWVLPDRTPTEAQLDYRQALRDLPSTADPQLDEQGNLTNVTWPTEPGA